MSWNASLQSTKSRKCFSFSSPQTFSQVNNWKWSKEKTALPELKESLKSNLRLKHIMCVAYSFESTQSFWDNMLYLPFVENRHTVVQNTYPVSYLTTMGISSGITLPFLWQGRIWWSQALVHSQTHQCAGELPLGMCEGSRWTKGLE